ncbi:MAG TPA: flagellar motor protein MotB [Burkholderiales bacterium]|nr:flagellar motor protein MotB [Burkholderiales bacterium]
MADDSQRPIVIKRIRKAAAAGHGGAWKIAYADFVTAMMAFFLLMWLLGSTTKGDLQGIAEYFQTPLKVALAGGSGSGDSSSVIQGGGKDLTRLEGQVKNGEIPAPKKTINLQAAKQELAKREAAKMAEMKGRLEKLIEASPQLLQFKNQLLIDITADGLRVQIVDEQNRPMFASGSAQLQPYAKEILREIAKVLNEVPNRITISGHTDAQPYAGGERGYSNWELSADRANASRRELIAGGMDEKKMLRMVGLSSSVLFDAADPLNPTNRRISIIVMTRQAEEAAAKDGGSIEIGKAEALDKEKLDVPAAGNK